MPEIHEKHIKFPKTDAFLQEIVLQIATPKLRVDNMENLGSRIAPWTSVAHNLGRSQLS